MSHHYKAVGWNRQKKRYDLLLWSGIFWTMLCLFTFQYLIHPQITIETAIIRTTSLTAFLLLHLILAIGPICRIDRRFLPLLYNRRHMGVSMFIIALVHGAFSIIQFHSLGDTNAIVSVFTSNQSYLSISGFPFQVLGFFALIILFLMAATSHDFWLKNLGPRIWKALHMSVYLAYGLIVLHVATGALQYESSTVYQVLLAFGFIGLTALHLYAGWEERKRLNARNELLEQGFYDVCDINTIDNNCGKSVFVDGENIAIFKYDGKVSAVNNMCKHQMGPLGEGKVIDGCITCPWHGYQYLPENGQSPPPFDEKLKTYVTRIQGTRVWVHPDARPEGTFVEPSEIN